MCVGVNQSLINIILRVFIKDSHLTRRNVHPHQPSRIGVVRINQIDLFPVSREADRPTADIIFGIPGEDFFPFRGLIVSDNKIITAVRLDPDGPADLHFGVGHPAGYVPGIFCPHREPAAVDFKMIDVMNFGVILIHVYKDFVRISFVGIDQPGLNIIKGSQT